VLAVIITDVIFDENIICTSTTVSSAYLSKPETSCGYKERPKKECQNRKHPAAIKKD
jgi:hypothetical protein